MIANQLNCYKTHFQKLFIQVKWSESRDKHFKKYLLRPKESSKLLFKLGHFQKITQTVLFLFINFRLNRVYSCNSKKNQSLVEINNKLDQAFLQLINRNFYRLAQKNCNNIFFLQLFSIIFIKGEHASFYRKVCK